MFYLVQLCSILLVVFSIVITNGYCRPLPVENRLIYSLANHDIDFNHRESPCKTQDKYTVYLIDNFDQMVKISAEITVSHGDLLQKILLSGRDDIDVHSLNTSLNRGLALVLDEMLRGKCVDAIISSIPGSNYSYSQASSILQQDITLSDDNLLDYLEPMRQTIRNIGLVGFPSTEYLTDLKVNSVKLRNDARKVVLMEAIGKFGVPVILPYGNIDYLDHGEVKMINILGLATNVRIFSGLDSQGRRLENYPYSPLSSGDAQAVHQITECPDHEDPTIANLDINDDGISDFQYKRTDIIPYYDEDANLSYTPSLISSLEYQRLKQDTPYNSHANSDLGYVVTTAQYLKLIKKPFIRLTTQTQQNLKKNSLVWINSPKYGYDFAFNPQCQIRGQLIGTSLIPPTKVKEILTP